MFLLSYVIPQVRLGFIWLGMNAVYNMFEIYCQVWQSEIN